MKKPSTQKPRGRKRRPAGLPLALGAAVESAKPEFDEPAAGVPQAAVPVEGPIMPPQRPHDVDACGDVDAAVTDAPDQLA